MRCTLLLDNERVPSSLDELGQALVDFVSDRATHYESDLLALAWNVKFRQSIPNTHNAPFGQPQNFSRKPDLPMGFPGWQGTIWFTLCRNTKKSFFTSSLLDNTGFHSGTGGSYTVPDRDKASYETKKYRSIEGFRYALNIYAEDWPLVHQDYDLIEAMRVLATPGYIPHSIEYKFNWKLKTYDHEPI